MRAAYVHHLKSAAHSAVDVTATAITEAEVESALCVPSLLVRTHRLGDTGRVHGYDRTQ